jgi:hypothetical protein
VGREKGRVRTERREWIEKKRELEERKGVWEERENGKTEERQIYLTRVLICF